MIGYLKFIEYGSNEYHQAAELRHRLFYREHNISLEAIANSQEEQDLHLVITTAQGNRVLAYGRLSQKSFNEFQIYQMVVEPTYQKQGLGKRMLQALIESASDRGGKLLTLNARVAKIKFYQKFGFEAVGGVFGSSMTDVPHIKMQKAI
jgi:predicted GNAT family N-acyltransferase